MTKTCSAFWKRQVRHTQVMGWVRLLTGAIMVWKHVDGKWRKRCEHCLGYGYIEITQYSVHCCTEYWEEVDHPSNSKYDPDRDLKGTGNIMQHCKVCNRVWIQYVEIGDDSLDVPAPECLGDQIPPLEWRIGQPLK